MSLSGGILRNLLCGVLACAWRSLFLLLGRRRQSDEAFYGVVSWRDSLFGRFTNSVKKERVGTMRAVCAVADAVVMERRVLRLFFFHPSSPRASCAFPISDGHTLNCRHDFPGPGWTDTQYIKKYLRPNLMGIFSFRGLRGKFFLSVKFRFPLRRIFFCATTCCLFLDVEKTISAKEFTVETLFLVRAPRKTAGYGKPVSLKLLYSVFSSSSSLGLTLSERQKVTPIRATLRARSQLESASGHIVPLPNRLIHVFFSSTRKRNNHPLSSS